MLLVMAGPPCAGKSAALRGLQARGLDAKLVVIEADVVFAEICRARGLHVALEGGVSEASQTAAAWQASREAILAQVSDQLRSAPGTGQDRIVCVDDTSEHRSRRRKLAAMARANRAALLVAELHIPYDVSLARNRRRSDATRVPEDSVKRVCDMLATTARHGSGASAWEATFRTRIDGLLSASQVVDQLEAAIGRAWSNKLSEAPKAAPPTESQPSAATSVDQQLRKVISVLLKQLRDLPAVADSQSSGFAGDTHEELGVTAAGLIRERFGSCDPAIAVREAAALLSSAKREAVLAARGSTRDTAHAGAAATATATAATAATAVTAATAAASSSCSGSSHSDALNAGFSAFLAALAVH
jgi:tRNA uridine 5-carbamoylmethylation protein Kti12